MVLPLGPGAPALLFEGAKGKSCCTVKIRGGGWGFTFIVLGEPQAHEDLHGEYFLLDRRGRRQRDLLLHRVRRERWLPAGPRALFFYFPPR